MPSPCRLMFLLIITVTYSGCQPELPKSLSAEERRLAQYAVQGLEVTEGLELTLFASEPMLTNPTNIDVDTKGRIWVCEGYNYRHELNQNHPVREGGDRILILEDTDGDGRADSQKIFYQGEDVNSALGIAVIGNQVIVSCSPNVLVFTDENGDDIPDSKEVLFSGIGGVQHDHGMHAFVFGPDGNWYFNFGNEGKKLLHADGSPVIDANTQTPISASSNGIKEGMVFRYDPKEAAVEVLGNNFRNNYEVAIDSYGTLWQSDNDDDGNKATRINYVMPYGNYGYKDEVSGAGWRSTRVGLEAKVPLQHWHLNDPGVIPNLLQTGAGSPTGITVYEGELLPERFHNQMIHCDAGPNVVRSYAVQTSGAGYSATVNHLVKGNPDNWFRPSDVCVAPDGSLFIADWYDPGVGGHQAGDLEKGRIYRLAPKNHEYETPQIDLGTPSGALEALKSPNIATRAVAWNALKSMGESARAELEKMWNGENPRMKARALWLLAELEGSNAYLQQAFESDNSDMNILAIRLAQRHHRLTSEWMNKMAAHASPQVRREVAIALRFLEGPEADRIWVQLAQQLPENDRWYLEALGIGADRFPDDRFAAWAESAGTNWDTPAGRQIVWRSRSPQAISYLQQIIQQTDSASQAAPYFRAMHFHPDGKTQVVLEQILGGSHPDQDGIASLAMQSMNPNRIRKSPALVQKLDGILDGMLASDVKAYLGIVEGVGYHESSPELYQIAMRGIQAETGKKAVWLLNDFGQLSLFSTALSSGDPTKVSTAISALSIVGNRQSVNILQEFVEDAMNPMPLRKAAVQAMAVGWNAEIYTGEWLMADSTIDQEIREAAAVQMLGAIRSHWREYAAAELHLDSSVDFASISELSSREGDAVKGQQVFSTYCATCHQVNALGINYGPDLSEIGDKLSREGMFAAIIQPSGGISFGYEGYVIETEAGENYLGYITSSTDEAVTLMMQGGIEKSISRKEISQMNIQEQSLMTPGLHAVIGEEKLVDLVEYLESLQQQVELASLE